MSLLKHKIAVVTGGSSGIGLATAKRFVEEGAYVFIAGRRQDELDKAVAEMGKNVTGVKTDISKLVHRFQGSNHIKRRCRVYRTKYGRRGVG